ncbi:MAG: hypothetical protein U0992_22405 [Planctomycetaceae bacterium]
MQAFCRSCNYHFEAPSAREGGYVKCVACGRRAEITEGPTAGKKSKKQLKRGEASCSMCGKTLAPGVRYCVACGTTNNDMGGEAMALDTQLRKSARQRLREEDSWWHMLLRMLGRET